MVSDVYDFICLSGPVLGNRTGDNMGSPSLFDTTGAVSLLYNVHNKVKGKDQRTICVHVRDGIYGEGIHVLCSIPENKASSPRHPNQEGC